MKFSILILSACAALTSCSSKDKAVNDYNYYVPVMVPTAPPVREGDAPRPMEITNAAMGQQASAAIEGTVLLNGDIPLPLSRVQVGLYEKNNADRWTEVTRLTTGAQGDFRISRMLQPGHYELRVIDKNYEGVQLVRLTKDPARGIILQVRKK